MRQDRVKMGMPAMAQDKTASFEHVEPLIAERGPRKDLLEFIWRPIL